MAMAMAMATAMVLMVTIMMAMMVVMTMQGRPWSPGGRGPAGRLAWTLFDWQAEVSPSSPSSS